MPDTPTQMKREIDEIPRALQNLLAHGRDDITSAAAAAKNARGFASAARGSSDHACAALKYTAEILSGQTMTSLAPSVVSLYRKELKLNGALCLAVSQSGQSPDIVQTAQAAVAGGAFTVALTNDTESPLAGAASAVVGIRAGEERGVAATKTFVNSLVAGLWLLAEIYSDKKLLAAIRNLPDFLHEATLCDWTDAASFIADTDASSLFTLGRGASYGIALEAALKFKEVCRLHAEGYSSAEVLHGPVSLVGDGFPVVAFAAADAAETALAQVADELAERGARVFATTSRARRASALPHVRTAHPMTDPVAAVVSFYGMAERVAVLRGVDPDAPRHLQKVTETI